MRSEEVCRYSSSRKACSRAGGPFATKRRTFVVRCKLPLFRTKWLSEADGEEGIYRNPVVLGREFKDEMDRGNWRSQAEFAATLGISPTRLRSFLHLTRLDPDVEELFISLGSVLPKGCVIGPQRLHRLLKLPRNEQMLRAKELLREAGMETEGGFD